MNHIERVSITVLIAVICAGPSTVAQSKQPETSVGPLPRTAEHIPPNPYLALHAEVPMEGFFAENERRIRKELAKLREGAAAKPIDGIQYGTRSVNVDNDGKPIPH